MRNEEDLIGRIANAGVVAVLVIDRSEDAVPLAHALLEGGVDVMELTLRTPAALEAARAIVRDVPEMTVGIGTILTEDQVARSCDAGASFGVSPGLNADIVRMARSQGFFFMPGIVTPSDVEGALRLGLRYLKFFPAEPSGGVRYLRSLAAPYAHLGIRYVPLGGVTRENMKGYLESGLVLAVGGSWIAPRQKILDHDWAAITRAAGDAREAFREVVLKESD